jgi:hypothetical protein
MSVNGVDDHGSMLNELKALRRGRGLHGPDVGGQIGPLLSAVSGIRDDTDPTQRRTRVIAKLESTLMYLPDEQEVAARVALGLHPEAQSRFLSERMTWLANAMDRNQRTAARRVDDALSLLAERLVAGIGDDAGPENDFAPAGWYVEYQQATVMLHHDPVRVHEVRRVRATRDGLSELTVSWSVSQVPGNELVAEMVFGGDLEKDEANSRASYWTGRIRLPRPLRAGEEHTCELILTTLPRSHFQPYFVLSPFRRCDEFVLRTKFSPDHRPEEVWALNRVPFAYVNENQPVGDLLDADGANEITRRFTSLAEGFSYGVRWRFPEQRPPA